MTGPGGDSVRAVPAPPDLPAIDRLRALPRVALVPLPTPLHRLDRFSDAIGVEVWMKRDDVGGPALAGNKVRKYELILGQAQQDQADTLITTGAVQSNSARAGAAAAASLGLRCILVLTGEPPAARRANLLLDDLLGAEVRLAGPVGWDELGPHLDAVADEVRAGGGRPVVAPVGASSPLGSLGFALAYLELLEQLDALDALDVRGGDSRGGPAGTGSGDGFGHLVHTTTSGGTHAGLVVGRLLAGRGPVPVGIDAGRVLAEPKRDLALLAEAAGELIGLGSAVQEDALEIDLDHAGER